MLRFFLVLLQGPAVITHVGKSWAAKDQAIVVKLCAACLVPAGQPVQLADAAWCERQTFSCTLPALRCLQAGLVWHEQQTGGSLQRQTAHLAGCFATTLSQKASTGSSSGGGSGGGGGDATHPTAYVANMVSLLRLQGALLRQSTAIAVFTQLAALLQCLHAVCSCLQEGGGASSSSSSSRRRSSSSQEQPGADFR